MNISFWLFIEINIKINMWKVFYTKKFYLQIWGGSRERWTQLEEHIPAESYTISGLKPNTQYRAVVR